jgi:glycosyltransferase involved in cell wall biosynthesis
MFEVLGVPAVTWLQAPPHTELDALRRARRAGVVSRGQPDLLAATVLYRMRGRRDRLRLSAQSHVIVGSAWSVDRLLEQGFPRARVSALPYPIDLVRFAPGEKRARPSDRPTVLHLGRLVPRKRPDLLIEAFELLRIEMPDVQLLVVGRPHRPRPKKGLRDDSPGVRFVGSVPRDGVPHLIRQATAVVQVSESENFGSSIAEALACGVPVVVGPTNGTADYIDGRSRVFDEYRADAIADAMRIVIEHHRHEPDAVRQSAREAAERAFPPSQITDRLVEILESVAGQRLTTRRATRR